MLLFSFPMCKMAGTKSNSVASLSDFYVKIKDKYNKLG